MELETNAIPNISVLQGFDVDIENQRANEAHSRLVISQTLKCINNTIKSFSWIIFRMATCAVVTLRAAQVSGYGLTFEGTLSLSMAFFFIDNLNDPRYITWILHGSNIYRIILSVIYDYYIEAKGEGFGNGFSLLLRARDNRGRIKIPVIFLCVIQLTISIFVFLFRKFHDYGHLLWACFNIISAIAPLLDNIELRLMPNINNQVNGAGCARSTPFQLEAAVYPHINPDKIKKCEMQCIICMEDYKDGEQLCFIPSCGHHFHKTCIEEWANHVAVCPYCRSIILRSV